MKRWQKIVLGYSALASVGVGCYFVFAWLPLIVVGGMVWLDLTIGSLKR